MGMLQKKENKGLTYYEVMHGNRKIAEINTRGEAVILALQFFPYDLYLEEERDFDTLINNMNNFYYWFASRNDMIKKFLHDHDPSLPVPFRYCLKSLLHIYDPKTTRVKHTNNRSYSYY